MGRMGYLLCELVRWILSIHNTILLNTLLYLTISPLCWRPPLIFELTCNTMSGDLTPESVELLHVISEPLKVELAYAPWKANTQRQLIKANPNKLSQGWVSSWEKNRYKNDPPINEFAAWPDHNSSPGPMISRLRVLSGS